MSKKQRLTCLLLVYVMIFFYVLSVKGSRESLANAGYKIEGLVEPDVNYSIDVAPILKSGFKVEILGTLLSATTSDTGYFKITDVPYNKDGYTIRISKKTYLYRDIKNVVVNSNLCIGTTLSPLLLYIGDMPVNEVQDNVINDLDVKDINKSAFARKDSIKYNEDRDLNKDGIIDRLDLQCLYKNIDKTPADYPSPNIYKLDPTEPPPASTPAVTASSEPTFIPTESPTDISASTPTPTSTVTQTPTPTAVTEGVPSKPPITTLLQQGASNALATNFKISGYIGCDFNYTPDLAPVLLSNFKVEILGTPYSTTTDTRGYFEFNNIPKSSNAYTIKISKRTFLYREVKNITANSDVILSTESTPLLMWAGDIPIKGVQDDVINDLDKFAVLDCSGGVKDSPDYGYKYNEDCDLNKDGYINMADLIIIAKHYTDGLPTNYSVTPKGFIQTPSPTPVSTPAPSVVVLPDESPVPGGSTASVEAEGNYMVIMPSIKDFTDVSSHWASQYIQFLLDKRILAGYNNKTIRPDNPITRAEAISLLCRALSIKAFDDTELTFKDNNQIPKWAKGYIKAAISHEFIDGYPDNTFKPMKKITRAETLVIINLAFSLGGTAKNTHQYSDALEIPLWARHYVALDYELGIVKGYKDNTFRPNKDITRAEFFAMMYNAIQLTKARIRT